MQSLGSFYIYLIAATLIILDWQALIFSLTPHTQKEKTHFESTGVLFLHKQLLHATIATKNYCSVVASVRIGKELSSLLRLNALSERPSRTLVSVYPLPFMCSNWYPGMITFK